VRIHKTTGQGASPPSGLNENRDKPPRPNRPPMGTLARASARRSKVLPRIFVVSITAITCVRFEGGR
jgi:hypothetical protein